MKQIFFLCTGVFLAFLWTTILLAQMGIFYKEVIVLALTVSVVFPAIYLINNRSKLPWSKIDMLALAVIIAVCAFQSLYFHDPFSGGRDDGVYANNAVYITRHNNLFIQNPLASSYPGFEQTQYGIASQFYPGYSVWIASVISIVGINAVRYVNVPLMMIGFISLYLLSKKITGSSAVAIIIVLLTASTLPFLWFTRKTFSENLAFALTWFGLLTGITAFENKQYHLLMLTFLSFVLLLTVRIESISLIAGYFIFVFIMQVIKKHHALTALHVVMFFLILIPAVYYYTFFDTRYISMVVDLTKQLLNHIFLSAAMRVTPSVSIQSSFIQSNLPALVFYILQQYNFYFIILMVPVVFIKSLISSEKNKFIIITIIFLLLPNFIYVINPSITFDQPWFLRRYMVALIPLGYMCLFYLTRKLSRKAVAGTFSLLFVFNLVKSSPVLLFQEFAGATTQLLENISPAFTDHDIVLVDYPNTGHYKLAEPLYFLANVNTAAVNSSSISEFLGTSGQINTNIYAQNSFRLPPKWLCPYQTVYVLTSDDYANILTDNALSADADFIKNITVSYNELVKTCELFRISEQVNTEQMAHVNIRSAMSFCSNTPDMLIHTSQKLFLYQLKAEYVQSLKYKFCSVPQ